jgi:hypothetical protein
MMIPGGLMHAIAALVLLGRVTRGFNRSGMQGNV